MAADLFFTLSSGERIPIIIETRCGARNVTLRPKTTPNREIHMSKPWSTSANFAIKFAESKRKWIEKIFTDAPAKEKISSGDTICFLGRNVQILHDVTKHGNH